MTYGTKYWGDTVTRYEKYLTDVKPNKDCDFPMCMFLVNFEVINEIATA